MTTVSFLWHLHQPSYRTADGVSHAPWTLLHAGGAYMTLTRAVVEHGGRGQVINIVPTLLEQLIAYRDGAASDPVADAFTTPAADLTAEQVATVAEWSAHVNGRQLQRSPRLAQLIGTPPTDLTPADVTDLQVLTVLAHAGEWAWRSEELAPLTSRGRNFTTDNHREVSAWLRDQPRRLIELWRRLADRSEVEVATSPYAHPIMPLLIDTSIVDESWAPEPPPTVPAFRRPEDARRQLAAGLAFMRDRGFAPAGCWPPEGSVSRDALQVYHDAGVRWLVTDEGILERSLDQPLREHGTVSAALYRRWHLADGSPTLFFRDRELSDLVGFTYGGWEDEGVAAIDLVGRIRERAADLGEDSSIVIALDGENAWSHYSLGGGHFLRTLMELLDEGAPEFRPASLADAAAVGSPDILPHLHPGSWINSVFATWIGHPEKTRAWELLAEIRSAIGDREPPPSMLLAEGSDWFWWLGEDNPTELAPLYDRIFRRHLADACEQAGVEPPPELSQPLKAG
jgi:alpha-amylase/alpha-mannosidase (GH57 family)